LSQRTIPPYKLLQAEPLPSLAKVENSPSKVSFTPKRWQKQKARQERPLEEEARPEAVIKLFSLLISMLIAESTSFVNSTLPDSL